MFFDWLTVHQDFDYRLPLIGDRTIVVLDTDTGEQLQVKCPSINHEGSFSTNIQIRISGNRLTVSGNPSRIDRLDNLFGLTSIDQCVAVYNRVLKAYGLPEFTKCTRVFLATRVASLRPTHLVLVASVCLDLMIVSALCVLTALLLPRFISLVTGQSGRGMLLLTCVAFHLCLIAIACPDYIPTVQPLIG